MLPNRQNHFHSPKPIIMLKNHWLIAVRNFRKHWTFALINVIGLTLGIAGSLLIFLWVQDELRYDRFHTHGDQLHQVMFNSEVQGEILTGDQMPYPMATVLQDDYAEIKQTVLTTYPWSRLLRYQEKSLKERGMYAGADFFSLFTFPLLQGEAAEILTAPGRIVLSESLAAKLFGTDWEQGEIVGKTITVGDNTSLSVTGVFRDVPAQSSLRFDYVIPMQQLLSQNPRSNYPDSWGNFMFVLYAAVAESVDREALNQKVADTYQRYTQDVFPEWTDAQNSIFLQPFGDRHLYGTFANGRPVGGLIQYVRIFSLVAVIVLLLACINFVNLTTAKSQQRAKEIGVRKAVGAGRWSLAIQFLGEALLLTVVATGLAVLLTFLLLPLFNGITGKELALSSVASAWGWLLPAVVVATGLLAGAYPAFFLSSLKTVSIIRGKMKFGSGGGATRKALVVFQFSLSLLIIIGTLAVHWQIRFLQQQELGMEKDQVVTFPLQGVSSAQYDVLKQELLPQPGITQVALVDQSPVQVTNNNSGVQWPGKAPDDELLFRVLATDENLLNTLDIPLLQGRNFSSTRLADTASYLVNQTAARAMGLEHPVGQVLDYNGQKGRIVGVVQDFHSRSLHAAIDPLLILYRPQYAQLALVKTVPGQTQSAIASIQAAFGRYQSDYPFNYDFLSDRYARLYEREEAVGRLTNAFALLAIVIACLGLFGLASFTAERRTKEIGIRKALGATVTGILLLLSKDYVKLILIATAVAVPVANYFIGDWLDGFAYRIDLSWWLFLVPALVILLVALLSVSVQSVRAAVRNPVDSLRYE